MNHILRVGLVASVIFAIAACEKSTTTDASEPPPFVAPAGYQILVDQKGHLDDDNKIDTVLILQREGDNKTPVELVVYSWISEIARSQTVLSADQARSEFTDIQIRDHQLAIKTLDDKKITESVYQLLDGKFTLTKIDQSFTDANSDYKLSFDLINSKIEESNKSPIDYKFDQALFEDANPSYLVQQTIDAIVSESFTNLRIAKKSNLVPPTYQSIAETTGDLNADGISDLVLAMRPIGDQKSATKTLIYFGKSDVDFQLRSESDLVIPPEMSEDDLPLYESISLTIENQQLEVGVFKFTSNIRSQFRFIDESFRLTKIESYATGAGAQSIVTADLINSTLEQTDINTMEESMPEETSQKSVSFPNLYFQTVDPEKILEQAINSSPPETITGILVNGSGYDNYSITIDPDDGSEINIYCGACGEWFEPTEDGEGEQLKEEFISKQVTVTIVKEANNGRLAGPSDEEEFLFLKELKFLD